MSADPFASLLPKAGCPSDLELDRWHAKELPPARAQALEAHAANCSDCQARVAQRDQGFAALAAAAKDPAQGALLDERRVLAGIRRRLDETPARRSMSARRWTLIAGLLACAAAFALVMLPRRGDDEIRAKGGLALHVFREVNGRAAEAMSGDSFQAGDRLRFVVDLPRDGDVRVLGVEAAGALYTAWPLDSMRSTRLARGSSVALPDAVTLDGSRGRETLYLALCPTRDALDACHATPAGKPSCGAECELSPFVLEKP